MILKQAMNPVLLIRFMQRLVRDVQRKVFLILDNRPARHKADLKNAVIRHLRKIS